MTSKDRQYSRQNLSEVGEKALIRDFIKPLFNSADDPAGVGDDCAMVPFGDEVVLLSTDRVPSDLTAFKLGILDFHGLGDYLARLNLSDIAACGGRAVGLLLNLGLPNDIAYEDVRALCRGFLGCAERHGATVLGGDITSACELSISATSIGRAVRGQVLSRRGARPGHSIFISRPLGLTPTAFRVFLGKLESQFSTDSLALLRRQFTDMQPMLSLGQLLGASGQCGACMDNTDGIGQSLSELSEASKCAFVVHADALKISSVVEQLSRAISVRPLNMVFDGGADFSLVGTLHGTWTNESASARFKHALEIIGVVESGQGVWLNDGRKTPLAFRGWNYFSAHSQ
jgi:thiamine-monophosphate kinase